MPSSCDNDNNKCYYCAYDYSFYSVGRPEIVSAEDCPPGTMMSIPFNDGGVTHYTCRKFLGPFPELSQQEVDRLYPGAGFTFFNIFESGPFLINNYCPMPPNNSGWVQPAGFKGTCCGEKCTPTTCNASFIVNISPADLPVTDADAILLGAATTITAGVGPIGKVTIPTNLTSAQAAAKALETMKETTLLQQRMSGVPVDKVPASLLDKIFQIFKMNGLPTIMIMPILKYTPPISIPGSPDTASTGVGTMTIVAFNQDKSQASIYNITVDVDFNIG